MLPPSSVIVALCLHGAHILSGEVLSSLVWPDLFTLQARLQLSNTHQNIYSLLYLQTCITFSVLPHLYFLCLLLTVFIILTCTPLLNLNISSTLCHSVSICISSILCVSLCLNIPFTMQLNAAGAVFADRAMWEHMGTGGNQSGSE